MKELVIDRTKWARGGYNGTSMLLNDEGNMCCLGFMGVACRIPKKKLNVAFNPSDVNAIGAATVWRKLLAEEYATGEVDNSQFAVDAMKLNDSESLHDDEREKQLKKLFAENGIKLRFVGRKRK